MKKIGRLLTMLTLAAVFLCVQAVPAFAASGFVTVRIPVRVILKGEDPDPAETYTIVLKADDGSYPIPDNSPNGQAIMKIKGSGKSSFYITYVHPGTYTYTVSQKPGTDRDCSYASCVYEVTVQVTNSQTEAGALDVVVKAEKETKRGVKCSIEFINSYPKADPVNPTDPTEPVNPTNPVNPAKPGDSPKTGDESSLQLYFALASGGALMLSALFLTRKKEEYAE